MARPGYVDSIANDDGVGSGDLSTDHVYVGGETIGSLYGSGNDSLSTLLGILKENENGTT
jgi:hypothetical protein